MYYALKTKYFQLKFRLRKVRWRLLLSIYAHFDTTINQYFVAYKLGHSCKAFLKDKKRHELKYFFVLFQDNNFWFRTNLNVCSLMLCVLVFYSGGRTFSLKFTLNDRFLKRFLTSILFIVSVFTRNLLRGSHWSHFFLYFVLLEMCESQIWTVSS